MACKSSHSQYAISPRCVSLSDFPDEIIHHIFSFMEPNYTAKVCTLSKRFHQLCKTSPYLNFSFRRSWKHCHCEEFISSFSRYLEQRGGLKMQRVRFTWHCICPGDHPSVMLIWLNIFLDCNVEEVVLHLRIDDGTSTCTYFPPSLFQSQHLKVLAINCSCRRITLQPVKMNSCLQVLTLTLAEVDNSVAEWISNFCPFLKCLTIIQGVLRSDKPKYDGLFIIKSSSLAELRISGINHKHVRVTAEKLRTLYIENEFEYGGNYAFVEINSPNIQELTWVGARLKLRFTEGLKMLRQAVIHVKPQYFRLGQPPPNSSLCRFLFESLKDLQGVRSLHLSSWFIQLLAENNCIPTGLGNVRHLSLLMLDTMTKSFASSVAPFMKELTSVEVFHIKNYCRSCPDENMKLLRDLMPVQPLKEFAIESLSLFDYLYSPGAY